METIYIVLLVSVLGPIIGSWIGVLRKPSIRYINGMLAFAAGVMLSISFLELIPESIRYGSIRYCILWIWIWSFVMFLLDISIPHIHPELMKQEQGKKLEKTAIYLIIWIFLHNLPEWMAIATGTVANHGTTAITIALAIAIHNIPEWICTSAPYFHFSKKRWKSFRLSSLTALPILVWFLLWKFIFGNVWPEIMSIIVAWTAGVMIYISGDELIPTSCNKWSSTRSHSTIFSLIFGIIFVILLGAL